MGHHSRAYFVKLVVPAEESVDGYQELGAGQEKQLSRIVRNKVREKELIVKFGLVTAVARYEKIQEKGENFYKDEIPDEYYRTAPNGSRIHGRGCT
jgi:hypothetical protein